MNGLWRNKKNGRTYVVEDDHVTDATNESDGRIMVAYKPVDGTKMFVRLKTEFLEKFDPQCNACTKLFDEDEVMVIYWGQYHHERCADDRERNS